MGRKSQGSLTLVAGSAPTLADPPATLREAGASLWRSIIADTRSPTAAVSAAFQQGLDRRRCSGGAAAATWPLAARAQEQERKKRIGWLDGTADDLETRARLTAFRQETPLVASLAQPGGNHRP